MTIDFDLRKLPAGQGPSKNVYLRRKGNGRNPTSFTIEKKTKSPMPINWPQMCARSVNAQLKLRKMPPLQMTFDISTDLPTSLLLFGRYQELFPEGEAVSIRSGTNSGLLLGVNYYDRWLQHNLGSVGKLTTQSYTKGSKLYIKTNLSITGSVHELAPPLLSGIRGINPSHFRRYVYNKTLLGVRVDCDGGTAKARCFCASRAEKVLPAMWITR